MTRIGSMRQELDGAEELFSLSATFQERTGKSAAELKSGNIWFGELSLNELGQVDLSQTLSGQRPFVVLIPEEDGYNQIHQGAQFTLAKSGAVIALFTAEPRYPENHKESYRDFVDFASAVMDDVSEKCGQDTIWPFNRIGIYTPPYRPPIGSRESDDFWLVGWILRHDVRGPG